MLSGCNLGLVKHMSCTFHCPIFTFFYNKNLLWIVIDCSYSFPDSLGDDLIVEVHDSKGKHYGRVLAQVATIAEDPVFF